MLLKFNTALPDQLITIMEIQSVKDDASIPTVEWFSIWTKSNLKVKIQDVGGTLNFVILSLESLADFLSLEWCVLIISHIL